MGCKQCSHLLGGDPSDPNSSHRAGNELSEIVEESSSGSQSSVPSSQRSNQSSSRNQSNIQQQRSSFRPRPESRKQLKVQGTLEKIAEGMNKAESVGHHEDGVDKPESMSGIAAQHIPASKRSNTNHKGDQVIVNQDQPPIMLEEDSARKLVSQRKKELKEKQQAKNGPVENQQDAKYENVSLHNSIPSNMQNQYIPHHYNEHSNSNNVSSIINEPATSAMTKAAQNGNNTSNSQLIQEHEPVQKVSQNTNEPQHLLNSMTFKGKIQKKQTKRGKKGTKGSNKRGKSQAEGLQEDDGVSDPKEDQKQQVSTNNLKPIEIEQRAKSQMQKENSYLEGGERQPSQNYTSQLSKKSSKKDKIDSNVALELNMITQKRGKVTEDYQVLNLLGKGGFGEVKRLLDHPNIVRLYEIYQDAKNIYLITEYLEGGELFDLILKTKHFNENIAAKIMKQLLSAVSYCHNKQIVHRDLKPENLLLCQKDSFEIKVIDFGLSRQFSPEKNMYSKMGTPFYIAPEVLKKKYNEKCDIWSCGVILYILLSGNPPFNGKNDQAIFDSIALGYVSFQGVEWKNISNQAKIFIKKMLQVNPDDRISAQQALNDPWIKIYTSSDTVAPPMAMNILNNLRSFSSELKFQQAVMSYLANQLSSKEEKQKLTEIFKSFDKNNDGVLSREELINGYSTLYGSVERATLEVEQILTNVDLNRNGTVDYSEFLSATMQTQELLTNEKLQAAFNLFDIDQNGRITIEEIKSMLGGDMLEVSPDFWKDLLGEGDDNGDGEISFDEFKVMMKKLFVK
eukprot:403344202